MLKFDSEENVHPMIWVPFMIVATPLLLWTIAMAPDVMLVVAFVFWTRRGK